MRNFSAFKGRGVELRSALLAPLPPLCPQNGYTALMIAADGVYGSTPCVTAVVLALLAAGAAPGFKNKVSAKGRPMAMRWEGGALGEATGSQQKD